MKTQIILNFKLLEGIFCLLNTTHLDFSSFIVYIWHSNCIIIYLKHSFHLFRITIV